MTTNWHEQSETRPLQMPDGSVRQLTYDALTWMAFDDLVLDLEYRPERLIELAEMTSSWPEGSSFSERFKATIAYVHITHRKELGDRIPHGIGN